MVKPLSLAAVRSLWGLLIYKNKGAVGHISMGSFSLLVAELYVVGLPKSEGLPLGFIL